MILLENRQSSYKNRQKTWTDTLLQKICRWQNKYRKRCSKSHVIRELQVKTTRYHYSPTRMTKIHNTNTTKCWWELEATGTLIHCWRECKMVQPLWWRVWQFLTKWNILLPRDPAITLHSIYPEEVKTYVHIKTFMWMFIAALSIIAKTWKQPRCPSVGEWINCSTSVQQNIIQW